MHRVRFFTVLLAVAGSLALLPATATAATTYGLTGFEVNPSPATFVGSLVGQSGVWKAVVQHDPLSYTGTTAITGGSFTITTFVPPAQTTGTIDHGTITAGAVTTANGFTCRQTFALDGSLNAGTGTFSGILTHYGFLYGGRCNAFFATFAGQAML